MYQIIYQTDEEKLNMYMETCTKEELAKMLIECNNHLERITQVTVEIKRSDK